MEIRINDLLNNTNLSEDIYNYERIINLFQKLSSHSSSELNIYKQNENNYLILISWKKVNTWKIDYPIKPREVHKQCYATKAQCIAIIKELFEVGHIDNVPGFIEVPIQDFTLDEMLEFKKEEEMMLRGEDPFTEPEYSDTPAEKVSEPTNVDSKGMSSKEIETTTHSKKITPKKHIQNTTTKNKDTDSFFQI